jgi:xanthine dehydrogenase accessory factor
VSVHAELVRHVEAGDPVVLATAVRTSGSPPCVPGQQLLLGPDGPLAGTLGCAEFDTAAVADAPEVLEGDDPVLRTYTHERGTVEVQLAPQRPRPCLAVLGATPIARWLLRWGRDLGYEPVLVESRAERVTAEHRQEASRVVANPAELPSGVTLDAVHTDHDAPDVGAHLAAVLRAGARTVQLVGSRRHADHHLGLVRAEGVDEEEVGRIRTPAGLDIGGRSPQEIALSVLAGFVAARHQRDGGWPG